MSEIRNYRDLDAWKLGMDAITTTYNLTRRFPVEERYGLVSQMRRAAVSIPSNVAEGQAVKAPRWCLRHVVTAIGSCAELDTQLEAAMRLGFVDETSAVPLQAQLQRLQSVLYGLRRHKERRLAAGVATVIAFLLAGIQLLA